MFWEVEEYAKSKKEACKLPLDIGGGEEYFNH
jgi:hypothetical protein